MITVNIGERSLGNAQARLIFLIDDGEFELEAAELPDKHGSDNASTNDDDVVRFRAAIDRRTSDSKTSCRFANFAFA